MDARIALFLIIMAGTAMAAVSIDEEANRAVFWNEHGNLTLEPFRYEYAGDIPPPMTYRMTACADDEAVTIHEICGVFERPLIGSDSDAGYMRTLNVTDTYSFRCDSLSYGKSGQSEYWCYHDVYGNITSYNETVQTSPVNWYTTDAGGATVYWNVTRPASEYVSVKQYFTHEYDSEDGMHHYCAERDITLQAGACKTLSYTIHPQDNARRGKWDLYLSTSAGSWLIDPWWDSDFEKRIPIYVNNTNGYDLHNYTLFLNVDLNETLTDGTDIRVTWVNTSNGSNEQSIGFFREDGWHRGVNEIQIWDTGTASGTLWIMAPYLNSSQNETFYIYYNNTGASDESNVSDAFLYTDDFNNGIVEHHLATKTSGAGCSSAWTVTEPSGWLQFYRTTPSDCHNMYLFDYEMPFNHTIYVTGTHLGTANRNNGVCGRATSSTTWEWSCYRNAEHGGGVGDDKGLWVTPLSNYSRDAMANEIWSYEFNAIGGYYNGTGNIIDGSDVNYTFSLTNETFADSDHKYGGVLAGWYGVVTIKYDNYSVRAQAYNEPLYSLGTEEEEEEAATSQNISSCQDLGTAGMIYNLTTDLYSDATCITFSADNITLDCKGHTIRGDGNASNYGINMFWDSYTTVKNCIVTGWGAAGIRVAWGNAAWYNTMLNNTAYNNSIGILMYQAKETTINDTHLYNNTYDLYVDHPGVTSWASLYANHMMFDNPAGTYENFTDMTFDDNVSVTSEYSISWRPKPAAISSPYDDMSMWVNITEHESVVSLDNVTWHYTDADVAGLLESSLDIYEYNGTYHSSGASLDTSSNTLNIIGLTPHSDYGPVGEYHIEAGLVSPDDSTELRTAPITFGFHCNGTYDSYLANLTVGGSVVSSGQAAANGTLKQISYSPPSTGSYQWNVTCWNGTASNSSATRSFDLKHAVYTSLVSPANAVLIEGYIVDLMWRCNGDNSSYFANVSVDGSPVNTSIASSNNSLKTQTETLALGPHTWYVECYDSYNTSMSSIRSFLLTHNTQAVLLSPIDNYATWKSSVNLTFKCYGGAASWSANLSVNGTDIATNLSLQNNTPYTYNLSIGTGEYNWSVTCYDALNVSTAGNWTIYGSMVDWDTSDTSINITTNLTYSGFIEHVEGFYEDYAPLVISIISLGFGFLVTRRIPQTMLSGAVGMTLAFFLSGNIFFMAGAMLCLVTGFAYKQAVG